MRINAPPLSQIPKSLDDFRHIEAVTNIPSSQTQKEFGSDPTFAKRHREWAHLARLSYEGRLTCQKCLWNKVCQKCLWTKARSCFEDVSMASEAQSRWISKHFLELGSLDDHKLAGFAFTVDDKCVVVFRGTKMTSLHNWCLNLQLVQVGDPPRHKGFQLGWESMKNLLISWLRKHSISEITLVGHSLGGAMAILAAFDLAKCNDWIVNEVVTFGCPQVGSERFAAHYGKTMRSPEQKGESLLDCTFNYVLTTDLVPRVLSWHYRYHHVGQRMLIDSKGNAVNSSSHILERILFPLRMLKENPEISPYSSMHIIGGGDGPYKPQSSVIRDIHQDSARQMAINNWLPFCMALPLQAGIVLLFLIFALLGTDVRRHEMDRYIRSLRLRLTTLAYSPICFSNDL